MTGKKAPRYLDDRALLFVTSQRQENIKVLVVPNRLNLFLLLILCEYYFLNAIIMAFYSVISMRNKTNQGSLHRHAS